MNSDAILKEAIRIGDELISLAEEDENGVFWHTMWQKPDDSIGWQHSAPIYNGVSGIILFLLELYKQSDDGRYLDIAKRAMPWTYSQIQSGHTPPDNHSFYSGKMGVAYTLMELYKVTQEDHYLALALEIAKNSGRYLVSDHVDDLVTGTSGTVLALLKLHELTGEAWLLQTIEAYARHLVAKAKQGHGGLYWGRSEHQIRGLCGISHGAGGLGFVFLELGRYFQNDAFYWMAEEAFRYETHFYDNGRKNWPDFRKLQHKPTMGIVAYVDDDLRIFTETYDVNLWCHGAAGVGLTRLRAFEYLQKPRYQREAGIALQKTIETDLDASCQQSKLWGFCLCHGVCGNAELFLEAYRVFQDEEYLQLARRVAHSVVAYKAQGGVYRAGLSVPKDYPRPEDTTLFLGNAGVGYFLLRTLQPDKVPSMLAPRIAAPSEASMPIRLQDVKRMVAQKNFGRTVTLLAKTHPQHLQTCFANGHGDDGGYQQAFTRYVQEIIAAGPAQHSAQIADVFTLELEKVRMDEAVPSQALLYIKEKVHSARAYRIMEDLSADSRLMLNPDIIIVQTRWRWDLQTADQWEDNLSAAPQSYPVLLKPAVAGIAETPLYPLVFRLLTLFGEGNRVGDVIETVITTLNEPASDAPALRETLMTQIKQLMAVDFLLPQKVG